MQSNRYISNKQAWMPSQEIIIQMNQQCTMIMLNNKMKGHGTLITKKNQYNYNKSDSKPHKVWDNIRKQQFYNKWNNHIE